MGGGNLSSPLKAIHDALAAALGDVLLRQAYVNPSPLPPPEGEDAVYFHLVPEAEAPLTEESLSGAGLPVFRRFAPCRLNLVFYGPRAEALAWQAYHRLYLDGEGQPRRILRRQGIFPVPHPESPLLLWEDWGKAHRLRADLVIRLRILTREEDSLHPMPLADTPPEVLIHTHPDVSR